MKYLILVIHLLISSVASSQTLDEIAKTVSLGKILPEDYNWTAYIKEGESTSEEKMRAYSGIKMVKPRLKLLLDDLRGMLKDDAKGLEKFNKMQSLWEKSAAIEVDWVAESWAGGTQQRAEIPKAMLRTLVMRVKYLKIFKAESTLFNQ